MTKEEYIKSFMNKNCVLCGTQSCVCHLGIIDEDAIAHCGRYQGDISDIPKIKSILEELEEWMKENNFTWDAVRKEFQEKKIKGDSNITLN